MARTENTNPYRQLEDARVRELVSEMTLSEKCSLLVSHQKAIPRLGLGENPWAIEIARGYVSRDKSRPSTVFPQPIGMAAMFDPELMERIGEAASTEARILSAQAVRSAEEGAVSPAAGLLTLGPTVDMERNPLWGRTEEAYGEDPFLAGKMAGAYTRGLRGDDPYYARVIPGLKHFYANNNEQDRGTSDSQMSPRMKREYYYEPFRRCIEEGGAMGLMAAYNEISGVPALCSPELKQVVKGEWKADFVMSDGGDFTGNVMDHRRYPDHGASLAAVLRAGADIMLDDTVIVETGVRSALEQKLITEEELDATVETILRLRMRLGEFEVAGENPYFKIDESKLMCPQYTALNREAACRQMILLENDGILPLREDAGTIALIGPQAAKNRMDWYTGYSAYNVSLREGLEAAIGGERVLWDEGFDRVAIRSAASGRYVRLDGDNRLRADSETPSEVFALEDWDHGSIRLQSVRTGLYVRYAQTGSVEATCEDTLEWFTTSAFNATRSDGRWSLRTWNGRRVVCGEGGEFSAVPYAPANPDEEVFELVTLSQGTERAEQLARRADTVVLCLGNDPMLNGRETQDRPSLALPASQTALLEAVAAVNDRVVMLLVCSYPYAIGRERESCRAVLFSSHAGPELGHAAADTLLGRNVPAGRTPMTWYSSTRELPDLLDYELFNNHLTYLYLDRKPLYPFGHGLSYTTFSYGGFSAVQRENAVWVELDVTNTGRMDADEVVQIYFAPIDPPVQRPLCQLCAFERRRIPAGQSEHFALKVPLKELRRWLPAQERFVIDPGEYRFMACRSSADVCAEVTLHLDGDAVGPRSLERPMPAWLYDAGRDIRMLYDDRAACWCLASRGFSGSACYLNVDMRLATCLVTEASNPFHAAALRVSADGVKIGEATAAPTASAGDYRLCRINIQPLSVVGRLELEIPEGVRVKRIWVEGSSEE